MSSSLRDLALRSLDEAKGQYDKAKRNGYLIFKAHKLLADCDVLLLKDKFNDIIQNCNQILVLIDREEEYSLMDRNRSNISYVKTVIKAANEDSADVSLLMQQVFGLDDALLEGDQYKLQKDLSEILPNIDAIQHQHRDQWGRFTAMDLNIKMDELLGYYKDLSKDFIDYLRVPIKELTEHLESIMNDIRDEKYEGLLATVKDYYYHYYQLERFLHDETERQAEMLKTEALKAAAAQGSEGKGEAKQQGPAPRFRTIVTQTSTMAVSDSPKPLLMVHPLAIEAEKAPKDPGAASTGPSADRPEERPSEQIATPPQAQSPKHREPDVEEKPAAELGPHPQNEDEEEPISWPRPGAPAPSPKVEMSAKKKKELNRLDAMALKSEINREYDQAISMYERLIGMSPDKNKYIDRREACYKKRTKDHKGQVDKKKK